MEKDVLIRVSGLQMMDNEGRPEPVEIVVPGEYYFKNGSHYLRYSEILDESGTPTTSFVKMSESSMEVRKKGLVNVHMVFQEGKRNMAFYTTPMGTMQLGISATGLGFVRDDSTMEMHVDYSLDLNDQHVADCMINIEVQDKNAGTFSL